MKSRGLLPLLGVFLAVTAAAAPGDTPAGGPSKPGICLVLSGGGARGLAHIGVLKAFEEAGLRPSAIVGTSAGALVGSLYSAGLSAAEIEALFLSMDYQDLINEQPDRRLLDFDQRQAGRYPGLTLYLENRQLQLPQGLINGQKILNELNLAFTQAGVQHVHDFDQLPIPFRCLATDLRRGQVYVFKSGRLAQAVRASISIPSVFAPVLLDDMLLVDGGILNNVPVDVAREMGYARVVAVNVSGSAPPEKKRLRDLIDIMDESSTLVRLEKDRQLLAMADRALYPDVLEYSISDFHLVAEIIRKGYECAREDLEGVKAVFTAAAAPPPGPAADRETYARPVSVVELDGSRQPDPLAVLNRSEIRPERKFGLDALARSVESIFAEDRYRTVGFDLHLESGETRLTYLVDDAPRTSVSLAMRYDTDYQFLGKGRLLSRDVLGSGSELQLDLQLGELKDYRAGLRTPTVFGLPIALRQELFFTRQPRQIRLNEEPLEVYEDKRYGFTTGATLNLSRFGGLYGELTFEKINITSFGYFDELEADQLTVGRVGAGLDTLDRWSFPRRGLRLDAHADWGLAELGSDVRFTRLSGAAEAYLPVAANTVLHLAGHAGWGWDLAPYMVYFAGGQNDLTLASFPLPGYRIDEVFGHDLWTFTAEYRRRFPSPALGLSSDSYLLLRYGVAGARVPAAIGDRPDFDVPFRYYHGAGIGYALATIAGPLHVILGLGESGRWEITFSLGPDF